MSDLVAHRFQDLTGISEVLLPFGLDDLCSAFDALTTQMAREPAPEAFSRDEWGYLMGFMRGRALRSVFEASFGPASNDRGSMPTRMLAPRDEIAIWLPNNVSLLGPLTAILAIITGAEVRAKAGSGSENLTATLRDHILARDPKPILRELWQDRLTAESFDRRDQRNGDWSRKADARIFFGGNAAAAEVEALDHKPGTPFFAFSDHSSLVWADPAALMDETALTSLWRVFQVYGKTGCTSPQRLVLIDGSPDDATSAMQRLATHVDDLAGPPPAMHIASDSVMTEQVARARGWQTARTAKGEAVFMAGGPPSREIPGLRGMQITAQSLDDALSDLPDNIQTIGHIASSDTVLQWTRALAGSRALRLVPVQAMHHYGPFWDGQNFWRGLFRETEIRG